MHVVINRLSKNETFLFELDIIIHDIFSSFAFFKSIVWSHVEHDRNYVAHHFAKLVSFGAELNWENHVPWDMASYGTFVQFVFGVILPCISLKKKQNL